MHSLGECLRGFFFERYYVRTRLDRRLRRAALLCVWGKASEAPSSSPFPRPRAIERTAYAHSAAAFPFLFFGAPISGVTDLAAAGGRREGGRAAAIA